MNTKTLAVGQEVRVVSGPYMAGEGTVIKVSSSGVDVRLSNQVWGFNRDGIECHGHGTFECGPWYLEPIS
jgi:hypothetical protein